MDDACVSSASLAGFVFVTFVIGGIVGGFVGWLASYVHIDERFHW